MDDSPSLPVLVRPFDPHTATEAEWRRFFAYRAVRLAQDFRDDPATDEAQTRADMCAPRPLWGASRLWALRGGAVVGMLHLFYRQPGTEGWEAFASHLDFAGGVLQEQRRRGVGRALLAALASHMAQHGQAIASTRIWWADGHAFMERLGVPARHRVVKNRLQLQSVDWNAVAGWEAAAASFTWEVHAGRVPPDQLAPLLEPMEVLTNDQPLGELEIPRMRRELAGYRNWYAEMDARGGEHYLVVLRAGAEPVAVCEASWDARFPDRAFQQLTGVLRPWRGRGLARAVKARMLRLIAERQPQVRQVATENARSNAAILAINQRLGFAVLRDEATYQLGRAEIEAYLAGPRQP